MIPQKNDLSLTSSGDMVSFSLSQITSFNPLPGQLLLFAGLDECSPGLELIEDLKGLCAIGQIEHALDVDIVRFVLSDEFHELFEQIGVPPMPPEDPEPGPDPVDL